MTWNIFYSYAHEDDEFRRELHRYLVPLEQKKKIVQWSDRKITPGADWQSEIRREIDSAHLILLLVSKDFLASDYCFGVEVDRAMERLKQGEARVLPILLNPCLWDDSRFSQLQILPREAKPITSWTSREDAFIEVAREIREIVAGTPPSSERADSAPAASEGFDSAIDLVRSQVRSYARLYERIRQRMPPSHERTGRMEEVFDRMGQLATASYPLLDELGASPSPGERLAAVAILQVFASARYLPFLSKLVRSEKPFVQFHAIKALRFAVGAVEPPVYAQLLGAIEDGKAALDAAGASPATDRQRLLAEADQELRSTMSSLAAPSPPSTTVRSDASH